MEGSEPPFFTRFFKWDSKKFAVRYIIFFINQSTLLYSEVINVFSVLICLKVHGNSFQRKLSILKGGRSTMNLVSLNFHVCFHIKIGTFLDVYMIMTSSPETEKESTCIIWRKVRVRKTATVKKRDIKL